MKKGKMVLGSEMVKESAKYKTTVGKHHEKKVFEDIFPWCV